MRHAYLYKSEMPPSYLEKDALILGDRTTMSLLFPHPMPVTNILIQHHETAVMKETPGITFAQPFCIKSLCQRACTVHPAAR